MLFLRTDQIEAMREVIIDSAQLVSRLWLYGTLGQGLE